MYLMILLILVVGVLLYCAYEAAMFVEDVDPLDKPQEPLERPVTAEVIKPRLYPNRPMRTDRTYTLKKD